MEQISGRRIKYYAVWHKILLVGEGDFSFSASLAKALATAVNLTPTSLDSKEKVLLSYENAGQNLRFLEREGANVFHKVDATELNQKPELLGKRFDRIVYNFPHAGFFGKEENNTLIRLHRKLVHGFFENARQMLSFLGEIHVTHKEGHPYDLWDIVQLGNENELVMIDCVPFDAADYPGYINRRGDGPKIGHSFRLGPCKTYKFVLCRHFYLLPRILVPSFRQAGRSAFVEEARMTVAACFHRHNKRRFDIAFGEAATSEYEYRDPNGCEHDRPGVASSLQFPGRMSRSSYMNCQRQFTCGWIWKEDAVLAQTSATTACDGYMHGQSQFQSACGWIWKREEAKLAQARACSGPVMAPTNPCRYAPMQFRLLTEI